MILVLRGRFSKWFVFGRHGNDNAVNDGDSEGGRRAQRQAERRAVAVPVGGGARPPRPRHRRHAGFQQPCSAHAHTHYNLCARN